MPRIAFFIVLQLLHMTTLLSDTTDLPVVPTFTAPKTDHPFLIKNLETEEARMLLKRHLVLVRSDLLRKET